MRSVGIGGEGRVDGNGVEAVVFCVGKLGGVGCIFASCQYVFPSKEPERIIEKKAF